MAREELSEKQVAQRVREKGMVRCTVTFEVVGKPAEHVEQSLEVYLKNLARDDRIIIFDEQVADVAELEDGMFSTFAEVEMLVSSLETLTWIAVNFSPASIEVSEPEKFAVPNNVLTGWYTDLLAKIHEISLHYRDNAVKNQKLNEAMNALIVNFVLTTLERESLTAGDLQKKMGIHKDQLTPFLDHLVEKKRLIKDKDLYSLNKNPPKTVQKK